MVSSKFHSLQDETLSKLQYFKNTATSKFHLDKSMAENKIQVISEEIAAPAVINFVLDNNPSLQGQEIIPERIFNSGEEAIKP